MKPSTLQTIPLKKSHGVYWLPAKPCLAGGTATRITAAKPQVAGSTAPIFAGSTAPKPVAAVKPLKNVVPVEAFEPEIQEEVGEEQTEELASSPSPRQELPALGEAPMDESEVVRKPVLKKIPETVSIDEYN